jgi:hypothetical protein
VDWATTVPVVYYMPAMVFQVVVAVVVQVVPPVRVAEIV